MTQTNLGTLDFLDAQTGWAPLVGSCSDTSCMVLYASEDGGATWQRRSEQPLVLPGDFYLGSSNPVVHLATPHIGWLFSIPTPPDREGRLFSTTDGGRTWQQHTTDAPIVAMTAHGASVWRLERRCPNLADPCQYTVLTSEDHGRSWSVLPEQPSSAGIVESFVRPSADVAYVLSDRPHGPENPEANPVLARTTDEGRSWVTLKPPCAGYRTDLDVGDDLAASIPMDLWLVCHDEPGSGAMAPKHLFRSFDGGEHWSQDLGTPNSGAGGQTAVGSPERACRGGSRTGISCTTDGGHTWSYPIGGAENPLDGGVHVVEFADEHHAWAIAQDGESGSFNVVWHTTNGGESWSSTTVG